MNPKAYNHIHLNYMYNFLNEHVNNCQYVQMALESLPKDKEVHQMRVEYKKSAVYGDMIYPRIAAEDDRTVVELCDENAKPYAVIEFRFA